MGNCAGEKQFIKWVISESKKAVISTTLEEKSFSNETDLATLIFNSHLRSSCSK